MPKFFDAFIFSPQVKINPLFTIIALMLGELLWGISGLFLAIPVKLKRKEKNRVLEINLQERKKERKKERKTNLVRNGFQGILVEYNWFLLPI